ncbi:uncharacterized protein THITE_110760 [Thermothielavioides terrestris NRRL 8126]|uniref:Uncharacterized protein n=1 Tax=Thermothielavioides terrestris (strain ATCC 38088 / NRRL 8126) TaxID=578455 RepID=G2QZ77_THETT|nr:uncharacterized protein THITE_110760 [Thermothielavioides terrestris NRRL 8126]AEO66313.1 hypothetical protein THITE_110760 [Thermothielavioides terrestris NRRL 8126]
MNITVTVPEGSSNHGNPNLLCVPPSWSDYIIFYFSNYVAHAATVIMSPGQGWRETIIVVLSALLLPGSGIQRAITAIRRRSRFQSDPLTRAARAGALCVVVREDGDSTHRPDLADAPAQEEGRGGSQLSSTEGGRPSKEDNLPESPEADIAPVHAESRNPEHGVNETKIGGRQAQALRITNHQRVAARANACVVPRDAVVHGQYRLPAGYRLVFVPAWAASEIKTPAGAECNSLASSYNLPKLLVSLLQIVWATTTLYRARGDQIQRFGYAAFGLTVAPYVFMSIMNIAGSFLNPEYAAIFMVRTPLMDEAESKGGFFVGEVRHDAGARPGAEPEFLDIVKQESFLYILSTFCGFIPLAIIGGLSRFEAQDSTTLQQVFTSFWVTQFWAFSEEPLPYSML